MIKKSFWFLFFILLSLLIFSCADSLPSISEVQKTIVYDFQYEDRAPTQKMVLFINILSDERRIDSIEIIEKNRELHWLIENPEEIKVGNKKYFGSSEIIMPSQLSFVDSSFDLIYFDLAQRKTNKTFNLSLPHSLKQKKLDDIELESIKNKEYGQEFSRHEIVLYDILKNPLYIGKMSEGLNSKEEIQKNHPQTFSYREFFRNSENTAVILCPEIFIEEADLFDTFLE